jgi:hypothetical protein
MINPQWGINPMNKISIIIRMLFAVTLFQQHSRKFGEEEIGGPQSATNSSDDPYKIESTVDNHPYKLKGVEGRGYPKCHKQPRSPPLDPIKGMNSIR